MQERGKGDVLTRLAASLRRIDIFKRLMMAFAVVIFLPAIVFGGFAVKNLAAQNHAGAVESARARLRNLDVALSERMRSINDISYKLYSNKELQRLLTEEDREGRIGEILASAKRGNPYIQNIEVVSGETQYPCAQEANSPWIYIDDLPVFRQEESYIRAQAAGGLPVWVNTSGQHSTYRLTKGSAFLGQYITHSRSVMDESGQNLGVIIINVSMDLFTGLLNESTSLMNRNHVVLLGNGRLVTYLNASRIGSMASLSERDTDALLREGGSGSTMRLDGKAYVVTTLTCMGADWTLADLAPRAQVQAGLYRLIRILAAIAVVCTVLMVSMSYLVTVSITRPLKRLYTAMEQVEIDAEDVSYVDSGQDEVGLLGKAFDRMLKRNQELVYCVYQIQLEKKEESLLRKQAELDALQMQMNPHFLYNTLDMIRWQMLNEEQGEGRASTMLMEFSRMLKLSTRRPSGAVSLEEELEHVKAYLRVVDFDREYPVELKLDIPSRMLALQLPKLSLQPLVENALVHRGGRKLGSSTIQIRGEEEAGYYRVVVENEGVPMEPEELEKINQRLQHYQSGQHIGLSNVNERLRLQLGAGAQLKLFQPRAGLIQAVITVPKAMPVG